MTEQATVPAAARPGDGGRAGAPPGELDGDPRVADQTRRILDGVRRLVQAEMELAKAEIRSALRRFLVALVLVLVGLLVIFYGTIWLLEALPQAFGTTLLGDPWKAYAVYGALFLVAGGTVAGLGVTRIRRTVASLKASQTAASIKENLEWGKGLTRRGDRSS